jgi:uncharacterized protein YegL
MNKLASMVRSGYFVLAVFLIGDVAPWSLAANQQELRKTVVIVLDDSGSMKKDMGRDRRSRMVVAKQAMQRLIETLPDDTQLGIVLLNGAKNKDGWIVPLGKLDKRQALRTVSELSADGGTPLGAVMQRAMDELLKLREKQPYGDYRLVVVTDGEATDAPVLKANLPKLVSRGVVLDVIGVDMQAEHSLVQRSHSYRRANDAASFERALKEIFAESNFDASAGDQGFELIAALPDELAEQALVALRESGQTSLTKEIAASELADSSSGQSNAAGGPSGVASSGGSAGSVSNATAPYPHSNSNHSRPEPEKRSFISGKLFLAVLVLFIIVLFKGLTMSIKRK